MSDDTFEIEDLVAKVTNCNFRKERHGEALIAAIDIGFQVSADEAISRKIMESLLAGDGTAAQYLIGMIASGQLPTVDFPGSYDEHRVSLRISNETLAIFPDAKVNSFSVEQDGATYKWKFKVQALQGDADANSLVRVIQEKCAATISPAQGELDLDQDAAA